MAGKTREGKKSSSAKFKGDLPPNKNVGKHADEIYGDTTIPERKKID
jgi:hypothetical protein